MSRVRLCIAWQKATNRLRQYCVLYDRAVDAGLEPNELKLIAERRSLVSTVSSDWLLPC